MNSKSLQALSIVTNQVNVRGIESLQKFQLLQELDAPAVRVAFEVMKARESHQGDDDKITELLLDHELQAPAGAFENMKKASHLLRLIFPGMRVAFSSCFSTLVGGVVYCYIQNLQHPREELEARLMEDSSALLDGEDLIEEQANDPGFYQSADCLSCDQKLTTFDK